MTNTKRNTPLRKQAAQKRAQRKAGIHTEVAWTKLGMDLQDEKKQEELASFEKHAQWKQFSKMRTVKSDKIVYRTGIKAEF